MYERDKSILLKSSASALNKNLCSYFESPERVHIGVIHKSLVNIVTISSQYGTSIRQVASKDIGGSSSTSLTLILQAKWILVDKRIVFVIAAQKGIQIFESDGSTLLHWHGFSSLDTDNPDETFARGISSCGSNLCVGTYDGTILVFNIPSDNNITFSEKLTAHQVAITDLCGQKTLLASADDSGFICLWKGETSLKKLASFQGNGYPATSLCLWKEYLVASYGSGELKVYDTKANYMVAEVSAHARWITAMDVAPESGLVLTVSEDSFIRVWQLKSGQSPIISHKFSKKVTDCPLHGACFLGTSGNAFCVTGYDVQEILCYRM